MRQFAVATTALIALAAGVGIAAAQSPSAPPAASPPPPVTQPDMQPAMPQQPNAAQPATSPAPQQPKPQITEQVAPKAAPVEPQTAQPSPQPGQSGAAQTTPQSEAPASAQRQEPPSGAAVASPQQDRQAKEALRTLSGQSGKQEPGATERFTITGPVLVNGVLNVPDADKNGQTAPAKFSARNAALDKLPAVQLRLGLDPAQRKQILESVRQAHSPAARIDAKVDAEIAQELPLAAMLHELPEMVRNEFPALGDLKYVALADGIALVRAPNRIVVERIEN